MDEQLAAWAVSRGGYISRSEILDLGLSDVDIRDATASQAWRRVRRGYFAPAPFWDSLSREARHVVLVRIGIQRFGGNVAASHRSSCAVRGRALWAQDLESVCLTALDGRTSRSEAGAHHRVGVIDPDVDVEIVNGIPCTVEPLALWEAALDTTIEGGLVTFDSALHADPSLRDRLEDVAPRFERWPQSRHARVGFQLSDGRSESAGESRGRHMFWKFHIPAPELQREVYARDGRMIGRTDYAWLDGHHLGEFDGMVKYQRGMLGDESPSEVVVREKRREDELRREGDGAGMSRLIWAEIDPRRQPRTAERVRGEIEQSARLYTRNRVVIPLLG